MTNSLTSPDVLETLVARVEELARRLARTPSSDVLYLMVYSGELDCLLAALTMATGAATFVVDASRAATTLFI